VTTFAAPKPIRRVISKPLRQSARDKVCTLRLDGCLPGNETVVFAHFRGIWALGTSAKPHDGFGCFACHHCHAIEENKENRDWCSDGDRLRALYETQSWMIDAGLITVKGGR
jgi:hypothetical protein